MGKFTVVGEIAGLEISRPNMTFRIRNAELINAQVGDFVFGTIPDGFDVSESPVIVRQCEVVGYVLIRRISDETDESKKTHLRQLILKNNQLYYPRFHTEIFEFLPDTWYHIGVAARQEGYVEGEHSISEWLVKQASLMAPDEIEKAILELEKV